MRERNVGSSIQGVYTGAAIHVDDLRTTTANRDEVRQQADVIQDFTQDTCLNLNVSKLEVVKISKTPQAVESLLVAGHSVTTTSTAKLKLEKVEIRTSVFMTLRKFLTPLSYPCS